MQFDREELLSVLADGAPALNRTSEIPGLDHFWFDGTYVEAYNGGLGIQLKLKTDLDCGLPGKPLLDLLRTSALKEVDIEGGDGKPIVIKMGRSRVTLASLPSDRNPWGFMPPSKAKSQPSIILSAELQSAFTRVSFVHRLSKPTQIVHNGITVLVAKDGLELYATDSKSMARTTVKVKPPKALPDFIAPWGFVERVLTLVEPDSALYVMDDCLMAVGKNTLVCSNVMELPEHPDLGKTMDAFDTDDLAVEIPAGLPSVLDRALILAGGAEEPKITIESNGKGLSVHGKYPLGQVDEQFALKSDLEKEEGVFRSDLVRRGLGVAKTITITSKVLVLRDDDLLYVVSAMQAAKKDKPKASRREKEGKLAEAGEPF
jgi:DNA polymerase III sliding clamp (beta) subunit (PCNA family)